MHAIGPVHLQAVHFGKKPFIAADPLEQILQFTGTKGFYNPLTQTIRLVESPVAQFVHEAAHALTVSSLFANRKLQDALHEHTRDSTGAALYPRPLLAQLGAYAAHTVLKRNGDTLATAAAHERGLPSAYASINSYELAAELVEALIKAPIDRYDSIPWLGANSEAVGARLVALLADHQLADKSFLAAHSVLEHPRRFFYTANGKRRYDDGRQFIARADEFLAQHPASVYAKAIAHDRLFLLREQERTLAAAARNARIHPVLREYYVLQHSHIQSELAKPVREARR
jgi:hypothetical protein